MCGRADTEFNIPFHFSSLRGKPARCSRWALIHKARRRCAHKEKEKRVLLKICGGYGYGLCLWFVVMMVVVSSFALYSVPSCPFVYVHRYK